MRLRGCEVWFVWKANIALSLCVPACLLAAGIRRSTCSAAEASTLSATPGAAALSLP